MHSICPECTQRGVAIACEPSPKLQRICGWKKKAPYSVMLVPPAEGPLTGYTLEMAFSS